MKEKCLLLMVFISFNFLGQGSESFTNSSLTASYGDGNFVGDNGVTWNFIECRNELKASNISLINQPAILLRNETNSSAIFVMSGNDGIGDITMKLYKAFNSTVLRQIDLYVNGNLVGTSLGFNDDNEHIYTVSGINIFGNVLIEIKNTKSAQIIIDDVEWSKAGEVLSINDTEIENFVVYPNPVNGRYFRIRSSNPRVKSVIIFNMLGKQVLDKVVRSNQLIDVGNLNPGIYILKVEEGNRTETRKLIIN